MPDRDSKITPINIVGLVEGLARRNEELEDLCGEILATLDLNLEKRSLIGCSPQATADMEELVTKWNARFRKTKLQP